MKNAEPAGIGSFLVAMLYSDILLGLADTSCPSSESEFLFFLFFHNFINILFSLAFLHQKYSDFKIIRLFEKSIFFPHY